MVLFFLFIFALWLPFYTFCRAPALHPATPFEKGVNPKTFLRTDNILSLEGLRIRNAGTMDFREPIYGLRSPSPLWVFCALVHGGRHRRKPKGFRKMPPTMHESRKHPQRGRRPVSIDRHPKINGSGIPGSLPFHEKRVARPQKKFSDRPLFQKGSPGAGRGPARSVREGVAHGVHRSVPENLRLRHSGFYAFP